MRRKLCILAAALMTAVTMWAQSSAFETTIIQEKDTLWGFGFEGINLYTREMHRIDIAYQTTDPEGKPCRMSGVIIIPKDVYDGEQICDGTVLYNHYAQLSKADAPSRGHNTGEDMVLANPLSPNYIMVIPDFVGFGITEDRDQWFCFGDANGHASLDCLLAAQELLDNRGIERGKYLINAGYSSGGYDAMAAQKVRDMEEKYREKISFDRTVIGGFPFDVKTAYTEFIYNKDQVWRIFGMFMILDSYNQHANLGFTTSQMIKEPYDRQFDDWVRSGNYTTADLLKELKDKKISDIIQDAFLTTDSPEYKVLCEALDAHALEKDWVPDTTQKYSVFHFYKDNTVPCNSGRAMLRFFSNYDYGEGHVNPFKKSIIPEMTHLTTNFVIPSKDHSPLGGILYYIGLAATMTALPVLYYDGELNTHYADLIKGLTPLELVKTLDKKYNLRDMIKNSGSEGGSIFSLLANITNTVDGYLQPYDLTFSDLLIMADDSGLSLAEILEIYNYLSAEAPDTDANSDGNRAAATADGQPVMTPFLTEYYINYLTNWYKKAK